MSEQKFNKILLMPIPQLIVMALDPFKGVHPLAASAQNIDIKNVVAIVSCPMDENHNERLNELKKSEEYTLAWIQEEGDRKTAYFTRIK
ncbi:MAG: hypothetical protein A3D44_04165 [Candidatus Staskawiczbacteria bacterium RIFCSPHIGHO2_02_FULL_42_22]|uniref:Uncharacterized protein n=2 Tax=Candidatus Staskawicziibacteriota TaxID=1817916 RepID=A0A1G2I4A9_9BACT|nr:MAG: hypothetical protein A3D44_04165 [Candidatus Staskawiczbacteria bacterium RIFCSPHIGHO2_02_FULL_42_22]OGZ69932.1 MAG: hypothetical protein A3F47_01335 [Candidatus Staskawiczbacteria bacterium RIFCSPHIGHO2_12_FULL_38_11]